VTIFVGTAATAAGPHAGGSGTGDVVHRFTFKGASTANWIIDRHGVLAAVLGLLAVATWFLARARGANRELRLRLTRICLLMAVQGVVGIVQFQTDLPSEIVWRLVSFARQDQAGQQRVNVNALITGLARFREPEWRVLGLNHQVHIGHEAAEVAGYEGQLEQAFLNLLVYAEQRASASANKTIVLKTSVLANRALLEIDYSSPHAPELEPDPFAEAASAETGAPGLEVCLGILRNHGGEARMLRRSGICGFEIELPLAPAAAEPEVPSSKVGAAVRSLTLALVDPDPTTQRALVALLGAKGHRVVPASVESAADIVQRLRFDAVLWAVRIGGSAWSEFFDRFRASIPSFVLISDNYDHDLARSLAPRGGFLLASPVQERKLSEVLREIAARTPPA